MTFGGSAALSTQMHLSIRVLAHTHTITHARLLSRALCFMIAHVAESGAPSQRRVTLCAREHCRSK